MPGRVIGTARETDDQNPFDTRRFNHPGEVALAGLRNTLSDFKGPLLPAVVLASVGSGIAIGLSLDFLTLGALLVAALLLIRTSPIPWVVIAVSAPWLSKLATATGLAPRALDFIDFPAVVIAAALCTIHYLRSGRPEVGVHRRLLLLAGILAVMVAASSILNWTQPIRAMAGGLLLLQPFILLIALLLYRPSPKQRTILIATIITIGCLQVLFAGAQVIRGARIDLVQGTLLNAGAAPHVMSGGLILIAFVVLAIARPQLVGFAALAAAVAIAVFADAKSVLYVLPLGLVAYFVTPTHKRRTSQFARAFPALVLIALVIVLYPASRSASGFIKETASGGGGKTALLARLSDDLSEDPPTWLFGFGPGETVSRFAFLTTPLVLRHGSPVEWLDLEPGARTITYHFVANAGGRLEGLSSFLSGQSSALGILGDYGVLGLASTVALVGAILIRLRRRKTPLAAAAAAGWAMLIPLAVIFDWLEQPPYTLLLAVITVLALGHKADVNQCDSERAEKALAIRA